MYSRTTNLLNKFSISCYSNIFERNLWQKVPEAPKDIIFGINEAFNKDTNKKKVNLGIGAYRDDFGKPWILPSVLKAAQKVIKDTDEYNYEYLDIIGCELAIRYAMALLYGCESKHIAENTIAAVQTPGGTGALRVAGAFLKKFHCGPKEVFVSKPTWGNHIGIFKECGLEVKPYTYYNPEKICFNFEGMIQDICRMPDEGIIILHACAHNPTGLDPTLEQWCDIGAACAAKNMIVIFDFAYQGFASGDPNKDAAAIRVFEKAGMSFGVCQSFSKNMGLYGHRMGTFSWLCEDQIEKNRMMSQLEIICRRMWSNPPLFPANVIIEVFGSPKLREQWQRDVGEMSCRIRKMRQGLKDKIIQSGSTLNWDHITNQIGMFCYTGLTKEQVTELTEQHHIYMTPDGRISICGLNTGNLSYVAECIAKVTAVPEEAPCPETNKAPINDPPPDKCDPKENLTAVLASKSNNVADNSMMKVASKNTPGTKNDLSGAAKPMNNTPKPTEKVVAAKPTEFKSDAIVNLSGEQLEETQKGRNKINEANIIQKKEAKPSVNSKDAKQISNKVDPVKKPVIDEANQKRRRLRNAKIESIINLAKNLQKAIKSDPTVDLASEALKRRQDKQVTSTSTDKGKVTPALKLTPQKQIDGKTTPALAVKGKKQKAKVNVMATKTNKKVDHPINVAPEKLKEIKADAPVNTAEKKRRNRSNSQLTARPKLDNQSNVQKEAAPNAANANIDPLVTDIVQNETAKQRNKMMNFTEIKDGSIKDDPLMDKKLEAMQRAKSTEMEKILAQNSNKLIKEEPIVDIPPPPEKRMQVIPIKKRTTMKKTKPVPVGTLDANNLSKPQPELDKTALKNIAKDPMKILTASSPKTEDKDNLVGGDSSAKLKKTVNEPKPVKQKDDSKGGANDSTKKK